MSKPQKYTKKPVEIEAMLYGPNPSDAHDVTVWLSANLYPGLIGDATRPEELRYPDQLETDNSKPDKGWYIDPENGCLAIRTLEGDMKVSHGDYVIRGVEGEFYPCRPEIFEKTYKQTDSNQIVFNSIEVDGEFYSGGFASQAFLEAHQQKFLR